MAKKHLVFLMLLVMTIATVSASTWKIHNYYVTSKIQNVFDTGDKIYYLNSDRLFQFDKATLTTVALNRQNKLSDNQISQIYYDWENKLLFVAYANSNIDIIDAEGHVTNINGIKNVLVTVQDFTLYTSGDHQNELASYVGKAIRDITFADGKAYVAMGYGFAVIDETTLTMVKSLAVRRPTTINSVTKVGDMLVLLSNSYMYYGDPESPDPINSFQKTSGSFSNAKMYPIDDHRLAHPLLPLWLALRQLVCRNPLRAISQILPASPITTRLTRPVRRLPNKVRPSALPRQIPMVTVRCGSTMPTVCT